MYHKTIHKLYQEKNKLYVELLAGPKHTFNLRGVLVWNYGDAYGNRPIGTVVSCQWKPVPLAQMPKRVITVQLRDGSLWMGNVHGSSTYAGLTRLYDDGDKARLATRIRRMLRLHWTNNTQLDHIHHDLRMRKAPTSDASWQLVSNPTTPSSESSETT